MTQQPTCGYILRAETGPCETCGHDGHGGAASGCASKGLVCDVTDFICCDCDSEGRNAGMSHPYLGPSLGVCGHGEDSHNLTFANGDSVIAWLDAPDDPNEVFFCEDCGSSHPFQPTAEEVAE